MKAALLGIALLVEPFICAGADWFRSSASSNFWTSVASSADGTRLIAAANSIFISTNSGASWFGQTNAQITNRAWTSVACSGDGLILAGVNNSSSVIFLSTNGGSSWFTNTVSTPGHPPTAVCMSGTGNKIAVNASNLVVSTDGGVTWTTNAPPYPYMGPLAMSANGRTVAWGSSLYPSAVFTSYDDGATWKSNSMPFYVMGLTVSADGSRLASACLGQVIYTSTNSGMAWRTAPSPAASWTAITCSADGTGIIAAAYNGSVAPIYSSADGGLTWISNNVPYQTWKSLAASADATKLAAAASAPSSTTGPIFLFQSWPSPKLLIAQTNNSASLSWTIPSQPFVLQSSSDLLNWNMSGSAITTNYSLMQNEASQSGASNRFFRLIGL